MTHADLPRSVVRHVSDVVVRIYEIADRAGIRLASVFLAGDGNLHPISCLTDQDGEEQQVLNAAHEMLEVCSADVC
jgi:FAD/FMN-containing dehydrogenase